MKTYPVFYNGMDYYITENGQIFDYNSGDDITDNFSDSERDMVILKCFVGPLNQKTIHLDGDNRNFHRKNVTYLINTIETISSNELLIDNVLFKRIPELLYYYISKGGVIYSTFYSKYLHCKVSNFPYYVHISLVDQYGVRKTYGLHRLVFYTFNGTLPNSDMEINHIDGRPWNNDLSNLEETTTLENIRHAISILHRGKITWVAEEIHLICGLLASGIPIKKIYALDWIGNKITFSGFKVLISHLISKTKFWTDISTKYDFSSWVPANKIYSDDIIHQICQLLCLGISQTDISNRLNVPLKYISSIKNRTVRKKITSQYNF